MLLGTLRLQFSDNGMMCTGCGMGGEGDIGRYVEYGSTAGFFVFVDCFVEVVSA